MLEPVDPGAADAPSEQLRRQVAARVADGDLAPGARLPTVRAAAEQLGLAAGTVAKAYRALEADGVVVTEGRRGTFVARGEAAGSRAAGRAAASYAAQARRLGLSRAEALDLVERAWATAGDA